MSDTSPIRPRLELPMLRLGDVWEHHPDCGDHGRQYRVVRVTAGAAYSKTVRETLLADYTAPEGTFPISLGASVVIVSREPLPKREKVLE